MPPTAPSRLARLTRAALPAAPLALGAIPSAQAVIVYTNPADMTISVGSSIFIDVGTAGSGGSISGSTFGAADFRLSFYAASSAMPTLFGIGSSPRFFSTGNYITHFSSNNVISGTPTGSIGNYLNKNGANNANWAAGTTGYMGVQFDAGSGPVNSWIQVSYNADQTLTVYDFAYESSGGSILAGAVPEPSTYAMMAGLLAGSAALYKRRQKNKAAA